MRLGMAANVRAPTSVATAVCATAVYDAADARGVSWRTSCVEPEVAGTRALGMRHAGGVRRDRVGVAASDGDL